MTEYSRIDVGFADTENRAAAIEIDVHGRWDALALSQILIPYHSFLVQHDDQRWVVHARAPGYHGEPIEGALQAIDDWVGERGLESCSCRVGGQAHRLGRSEQA